MFSKETSTSQDFREISYDIQIIWEIGNAAYKEYILEGNCMEIRFISFTLANGF